MKQSNVLSVGPSSERNMFFSHKGRMLETLDNAFDIGSTPTFLYFDLYISNSLIIHEGNTKEINTETEFGYVMKHLHKIKPTFISIFSLNTDLFEMLDQTLLTLV